MNTYIVTFGQKHRKDAHPVLGLTAHPDGFMTIERETENEARLWLRESIDDEYSMIYPSDYFYDVLSGSHLYPFGHIGNIEKIIASILIPESPSLEDLWPELAEEAVE